MKIKFLTWNTQLYEYGNTKGKTIKNGLKVYNQEIEIIKKHFFDLSDDEKAIAVLQEIPYRIKINRKWCLHPVFKKFKNDFPDTDYDIIYHSGWHIKMTVVIASKGIVSECKGKPFKAGGQAVNNPNGKIILHHIVETAFYRHLRVDFLWQKRWFSSCS